MIRIFGGGEKCQTGRERVKRETLPRVCSHWNVCHERKIKVKHYFGCVHVKIIGLILYIEAWRVIVSGRAQFFIHLVVGSFTEVGIQHTVDFLFIARSSLTQISFKQWMRVTVRYLISCCDIQLTWQTNIWKVSSLPTDCRITFNFSPSRPEFISKGWHNFLSVREVA